MSQSSATNTLNEQASRILEQATQAGATADLIIDQSQSLSLSANKGLLEKHEVSSTQIMGLRVVKDNRIGTAYSEATDEQSLSTMVEQAITNSQFSDEDKHEQILDYDYQVKTDDSLLCPTDTVSIEDKIQSILTLEDSLLQQPHIQSVPYNGLSNQTVQRYLYSTSGLMAYGAAKSAVAYAYALANDGKNDAMEGHGQIFRTTQALDIDLIAKKSYDKCMAMLAGKPIASGHYDVIFDEDKQANLFSTFAMVLSGKSAKDGINPWADKIGQCVADKRLSLYDDPLCIEGQNYSLFDSEGTPTQRTDIIQNGQLTSLLHNSATAHYFGLKSTGNATRSAKSTLSVSDHQLMIPAGVDSESTLKAGQYLLITDLTGLHSGANAISGDFSLGASGFLCQDGEIIQPVKGITVAGNFYTMLNQIAAIGDVQHWDWYLSSLMPSIRFEGLAVSGT